MSKRRTEHAIVAEIQKLQRQEDGIRERKRALDRELAVGRTAAAASRDDTDATVVALGEV